MIGPATPEALRGPGREAALVARAAIEETLLGLREIPRDFDRAGVRDRLLRAIAACYAVLDNPVIAAVHLDGLTQGAAMAAECRAVLARVDDPAALAPLREALGRLGAAEAALRSGAEAVARIQLARRGELIGGRSDGGPPPEQPFRASVGLPSLHAIARPPLLPHVSVEPETSTAAPRAAPVALPRPASIEELKAFAADAASGALERRFLDAEPGQETPRSEPPVPAYEPAIEEVEVLRRLGRDCLEDLANHRTLRKPNAIESWLDQAPFEQRLLDSLDAFASVAGAALPLVSLFHAEAKGPDPERAFAAALAFGSIAGRDTVAAAVMTLKLSQPEEHSGWTEGFWLAPSPAIDEAMADLTSSPRPELVVVALDVLHARGSTPDAVVAALLDRPEPAIGVRIARALATALPRQDAIAHLERTCAAAGDDALFLAAVESLLRRGHDPALGLLRRAIDAPASAERCRRAAPLLCLAGRASDLDRLLAAANAAPTAHLLRGLGRFGHIESLGPLLSFLEHENAELVAAAAEALDRITGAGLREIAEEPWEVELPLGTAEAGGIPVPTRKVERIVTDPERWSTWLRTRAPRLDARLKIRGGAAFMPLQIVDELESRITPPAAREEAALELVLVTGLLSQFSPHDWVPRQRQHLSDLRARVAAHKFTPGAWSYGLMREPARAASPLPSRVSTPASSPVTSFPESGVHPVQRMPDAWPHPHREGAGTALSAPPQLPESGQPAATDLDAPTARHGAARSQTALPATAWAERTGRDVSGDQHDDLTRTIDAFAPSVSLPFRPSRPAIEEPRDLHVSEQTAPNRTSVDLGKTITGPMLPAPPALPFHTTDSTRSDTAGDVKRSPYASVDRTASTPSLSAAPVLPFRPAKSSPEQDISNTAPALQHPLDASTSSTVTRSVPVVPPSPVMPFRPSADSSGPTPLLSSPIAVPAHSSGGPSSSAPPLPSRQPNPPGAATILSLAQYASLCAELAVFPWATEVIFKRYGLETGHQRQITDASWKERLRGDREQYEIWQQMYRSYHDYWTKRGAPGG